jgi:hypothetical protein
MLSAARMGRGKRRRRGIERTKAMLFARPLHRGHLAGYLLFERRIVVVDILGVVRG